MCCLASFQKDSAFVDSSPRKVPRQISCSAGGDSMLTGPKKGATMYFGVTRERRSQAGCHIYSFEICVKRVVVLFESSSDRFSSTIALSGGKRTTTSANATATQCASCKGGITHLSHVHRRTHVTCLAQLYSLFSTVASLLSQSSPQIPITHASLRIWLKLKRRTLWIVCRRLNKTWTLCSPHPMPHPPFGLTLFSYRVYIKCVTGSKVFMKKVRCSHIRLSLALWSYMIFL